MSFSFIAQGTSYGEKDKRFIHLKTNQYKMDKLNPDINWAPSGCKFDESSFLQTSVKEIFSGLSLPSGSSFISWNTPWAFLTLPNTIARDILEKRFIEKYSNNILINKYEYNNKAYLFVITKIAIIAIYSTIVSNSKALKFIENCELYITGIIDENMKSHLINDTGRPNQYLLIPKELKIKSDSINANINEVSSEGSFESYLEDKNSLSNKYLTEGDTNYSNDGEHFNKLFEFTEESNSIFSNVMNGKLANITLDEIEKIEQIFKKFKYGESLGLKLTLTVNSEEKNLNDILKIMENAIEKIKKV